ncbi:GreA/GreB family elongation factor [Flavobacterium amniphilum]|uniref:GreA/GreB family elongation factor n=1 Tax=Flavobacterium amniphilum TaxID=1834035 RepID=UPI00202A371A|nr:GreA/GreB family elongation factor [Flavobacterium amniphilum]MCL9807086.1 GreA/GreB family elongation factor [Flavobacterium amniphilum]
MSLKQTIYKQYLQIIQDKIDVFQDMISGLTEDSLNDAKGSAGDKHETALSMMHLEQEKLTNKLKEAIEHKAILEKIDTATSYKKAAMGSLVKTNNLTVFIAAALPKITIDGQNIFGISPQSPLGSELIGKEAGHSFQLNSVQYQILSIE